MYNIITVMESFRKWFYKPRRDDTSYLAQFFYADEALNLVAAELDSFDGRKDPERCTTLVSHLRQCQDKVLNICSRIMDEMIPNERADRDFRVKFPDDVMQDNLAGQLWFGAECLAAGSSIMNREIESVVMRPLAKALTKSLEEVRGLLREAALRTPHGAQGCHLLYTDPVHADRLVEALKIFDRLLAQFELSYVSAMVPVKTALEYEIQQCVVVLFSETLQRALSMGLLEQDQVDQCDPGLMFTIPRLAIVAGLLIFPHGPLSLSSPDLMSDMFRPFRQLLMKIRELLWTLSESELMTLEKMLCSSEDPCSQKSKAPNISPLPSQNIFRCDEEDTLRWEVKGVDGEGSSRWSLRTIPCDCTQSQQQPNLNNSSSTTNDKTTRSNNTEQHNNTTERFNDSLSNNNISRNGSNEWDQSRNQSSNVFPISKSPSISVPRYKEKNVATSCLIYTDDEGSPVSNSSISSSDTSSYNSDCQDEMEVALAVKAAEFNCSREARSKFKSSEDLLQRLFVCISGVADQLQTNFAGDLRNILKSVFLINASDRTQFDTADTRTTSEYCEQGEDIAGALNVSNSSSSSGSSISNQIHIPGTLSTQVDGIEEDWHQASTIAPPWIPDEQVQACMSCRSAFTVIRRRHHCRNCGKIFCARCSSNSVPLPKYGHMKPVRVCNRCFIYQLTPFTLNPEIHTPAN